MRSPEGQQGLQHRCWVCSAACATRAFPDTGQLKEETLRDREPRPVRPKKIFFKTRAARDGVADWSRRWLTTPSTWGDRHAFHTTRHRAADPGSRDWAGGSRSAREQVVDAGRGVPGDVHAAA